MMSTQTNDLNLDRFEQQLRATLYRFDCPSGDQLRELCWNKADATQAERLRNHLTICPLCNEEYAELQQLISSLNHQVSPAAAVSSSLFTTPGKLATRLVETLHSLRDNAQQTIQEIQREVAMVVARLVSVDESLQTATVALRGESKRTFFFECNGDMLSLIVQKDESAHLIMDGQLLVEPGLHEGTELGEADAFGKCFLQADQLDQPPRVTEIDELGHFVFLDVPSGDYQLTIELAQQHIFVPTLSLRG